jgi:hypothetical protein
MFSSSALASSYKLVDQLRNKVSLVSQALRLQRKVLADIKTEYTAGCKDIEVSVCVPVRMHWK